MQALKTRAETTEQSSLDLTNIITSENKDIPIIETDENDKPSGEGLNLDSSLIKKDSNYLRKKLAEFKKQHDPITIEISNNPLIINKYYYGDSDLLKQVRYYPIVQLFIVALVHHYYLICHFHKKHINAKPGMGRHGKRNSAPIGHSHFIVRGLGGNVERKSSCQNLFLLKWKKM